MEIIPAWMEPIGTQHGNHTRTFFPIGRGKFTVKHWNLLNDLYRLETPVHDEYLEMEKAVSFHLYQSDLHYWGYFDLCAFLAFIFSMVLGSWVSMVMITGACLGKTVHVHLQESKLRKRIQAWLDIQNEKNLVQHVPRCWKLFHAKNFLCVCLDEFFF
jgi:hypothetical protein